MEFFLVEYSSFGRINVWDSDNIYMMYTIFFYKQLTYKQQYWDFAKNLSNSKMPSTENLTALSNFDE